MQKKSRKKSKLKKGCVFVKSKRKRCVARAIAKKGTGKIIINKIPLENFSSKYVKMLVKEPTIIAPIANQYDFYITTHGGGSIAQAIAARSAIAKAVVELSEDEKVKNAFLAYDRLLLVDDVRRTEPKKPLGPKARKKKQKSKR